MKLDNVPVDGRRRKLGALVDVDNKTARALALLRIAEVQNDPHIYERADMTAEPAIEEPKKPRKRAYKRADLRAAK